MIGDKQQRLFLGRVYCAGTNASISVSVPTATQPQAPRPHMGQVPGVPVIVARTKRGFKARAAHASIPFSPISHPVLRRTIERVRSGSIEAVGASRIDVSLGQANVAQMEVGQVAERALYVAAGPPFTDKGQQTFERPATKSTRHAQCGPA
ncbi:hypothetical protein RFN28_24180 [Mesorhizobium sp. VK24D]|uniref:Uncharacterized protein n=1 Tax=Mesorhizobium album TaxID=3072314 RepID=A0ABU4Y4A8_9HYPH|nr:hypothetical protein [Mesorhizobium sp. VK24D]MDX8481536.1 hypothetical protein [Mesorhizobium sp. VK24D]